MPIYLSYYDDHKIIIQDPSLSDELITLYKDSSVKNTYTKKLALDTQFVSITRTANSNEFIYTFGLTDGKDMQMVLYELAN